MIFKKGGVSPKVSGDRKEKSKLSAEKWNQYFAGHWNFPGEKQNRHLAMFPEELPRRLIRMFRFAGDTVLDPFLGSGTTSLAAKKLERNSIGYEINAEFAPVILEKIGRTPSNRFGDCTIEMVEAKRGEAQYQQLLSTLPYMFSDPVRFDKKVDVKKRRFGSKIDGSEKSKDASRKVNSAVKTRKISSGGIAWEDIEIADR